MLRCTLCDYSNVCQLKRRIPITNIDAVTVSEVSDEFIVHVPGEGGRESLSNSAFFVLWFYPLIWVTL